MELIDRKVLLSSHNYLFCRYLKMFYPNKNITVFKLLFYYTLATRSVTKVNKEKKIHQKYFRVVININYLYTYSNIYIFVRMQSIFFYL